MLTRSKTKRTCESFVTIDDGEPEMKEFYRESRLEEIKMCLETRGFVVVPAREAEGHRWCTERFVDRIKRDGSKDLYYVYPLVVTMNTADLKPCQRSKEYRFDCC